MKQTGIDLRSFLRSVTALTDIVGERVHQNNAPQSYAGPYIWIGRGGTANEDELNEAPGTDPFTQYWDVECYSEDLDQAEDLAEIIHDLAPHRGAFGDGTVQRLTITDHTDDYLPRGIFDDAAEGLHLAALQVSIMGYASA